jgi:acyl carrier protein
MTAFGAGLTWGAATVVWPGLNPSIPPTGATTVNASLRAILVDELKLDPQALRAEARPEDAGLDSLALVELNMLLRDHCGVEIGEDVLSSATTVEALDRMVEQRLSRR